MWKDLRGFFQNKSDHRKLALKDKLRKINIEKGDIIPKYLTNFTQFRDELGSVDVIVHEEDIMRLEPIGIPKS